MKCPPSLGSCAQTLAPQLIRAAVEPFGSGAVPEEVGLRGTGFEVLFLSTLPVPALTVDTM